MQEKLQAEKKTESANHGLKRKRPIEKADSKKKPKTIKPALNKSIKPTRKMGLNGSKEDSASTEQNAKDEPKATGSQQHQDTINSGLHPTHKAGKYLALDCEMVGTGPPPHSDHVLARVSVTNFHGEQIYDSYVLPPPGIEVKDYRTFVSGIQPHHLRPGYARPLAEVQKVIADLLDGRVLVGHALRNDLDVLLLSHPRRDIRDTSRYPKFRKQSHGAPALRDLALRELGLEIQGGEHSSLEDARAAMMLFRREKGGIEEEVRRRFGGSRRGKGKSEVKGEVADRDDDEDAVDEMDGEESDGSSGEERVPKMATKKKRKKKKRTKRK